MLVGINLLREGLDIPEVSLIAILDADKEGFLRSETSLIQTIGRAARNVDGMVIMYADTITGSMRRAIDETERRRKIQEEFNEKHGITPKSVTKNIRESISILKEADEEIMDSVDLEIMLRDLKDEMILAAECLEFERAAELRDRIKKLKEKIENE